MLDLLEAVTAGPRLCSKHLARIVFAREIETSRLSTSAALVEKKLEAEVCAGGREWWMSCMMPLDVSDLPRHRGTLALFGMLSILHPNTGGFEIFCYRLMELNEVLGILSMNTN